MSRVPPQRQLDHPSIFVRPPSLPICDSKPILVLSHRCPHPHLFVQAILSILELGYIISKASKSNYANVVMMARTGDFSFPEFNFGNPQPSFTQTTGIPAPIQTQKPFFPASSAAGSPTVETPTPLSATSQKRKASSADDENLEDSSRAAAEEDKRRRNTAASARFRVKKKQREQALEKSAKEMSDKVAALEGRINQLETENKWLKNLVTEKNESNDDIATLWKKHSAEKERETGEGKDGVGTKA